MTLEKIFFDNIDCNGCAKLIKNKVSKMLGVSSVTVDLQSGLVSVFHEGFINTDFIKQKLAEAGFPTTGKPTAIQKFQACLECKLQKKHEAS